MEMTRVPEAGFEIVGLPIAGLQRRLAISNLLLPFKVFVSLQKAISLVRSFKPQVVIGVGGYASAPLLLAARLLGIPYLIQEQNSFAGLTNKLLGRKAKAICVAFPDMERYFPEKKIHFTGNPIRKDLLEINLSPYEALAHFGLQPGLQTILVIGGSLGAKTINESVSKSLADWSERGYQLIWQTGKGSAESARKQLEELGNPRFISMPFIKEMNHAYCAADVVISRAGALSIAEICITGKASILVPSPNVAEDHQTKNAMTLVNQNAAFLVADKDARNRLSQVTISLLDNPMEIEQKGMAAYALARPNATKSIVNQVIEIAKK
jgi:UDP-N-acetylglucosamine--N-acetylmuramyl-(pentapeptide) pyrophosphoryl-undecaprenol N-acetylglucosamine transferase